MQQLRTWRLSDEEEKCVQAFRTTIYEKQKDFNVEREPRTCLWCLDDERFRNWRDKSTSCLLWVTADPGCGKSVLSKALVDEQLLNSVPNDTTTCYFFFKDTSEDQRSPVCALAALLHQLFTSEAGAKVIKHALPAFRENKDKISQNFEVMWKIIRDITLDPDCGKIVFLLDALDECQSSEQKNLIAKLKRLEQNQVHLRTAKNVKFFITSRPYWNIEKEFDSLISDIPGIRLKGENQSESLRSEIDCVIRARVSQLGRQIASAKAQNQLLEGLLKVENRTYLWLQFVFDFIALKPRIDTKIARSLLHDLPITVEAAYDKILQKSSDQEQAKRLLRIVVAATRPLSVNEIGVALYITEETRTYEDLELQDNRQLEVTIRDLCGLFVRIVEGKVLLIHQTAKEFLVAQNNLSPSTIVSYGTWKHSLFIQDSNLLLTSICIWFLRLEEFSKKSLFLKQKEIDQLISRYEFLEYSAVKWAVHFRATTIPENSSCVTLGLELCDVEADRYMSWELVYWQKAKYRSPPTGRNNLQLASLLGLKEVVGQLLTTSDIDVNAANKDGETPLLWAVYEGHEAIVNQLLAAPNIDVNAANKNGWTPLWRVVYKGDETIVSQLLAAPNIDINAANKDGWTPLWLAVYKGHEAIVSQLLATSNINVNAANKDGETPLWRAFYKWDKTIVSQLLAAPNIDVNAANKDGETPLWRAVYKGDETIVSQLLATSNINVNATDKDGETPLWRALYNRHEAIVSQLLATPNINVNAANIYGGTPLWWTVYNRHETIVSQLLAASNIDVNAANIYGGTPLWLAVYKRHEAIVSQLLATPNIDINAVDRYNETPLWRAVYGRHEAIVSQLLAAPNIDINAANIYNETPLWRAVYGGHEAIVSQLLAAPDININTANEDGQTPFSVAQGRGYKNIAKLLENS